MQGLIFSSKRLMGCGDDSKVDVIIGHDKIGWVAGLKDHRVGRL